MTTSSKKKKEKAKDFQKTKLKVGKARPKNTNATDTSFSSRSIVLKQQSLSETARSPAALFTHNLSLLSSKSETQRRDALQTLTVSVASLEKRQMPVPASILLSKAQPLILDGNKAVRENLVKLLRLLPPAELGSLDQLMLYVRAGMAHLSNDVRSTALDVLGWCLAADSDAVLSCPGTWIKTLQTFQNLLAWTFVGGAVNPGVNKLGNWTATKAATNLGNPKLIVHQLNTLATFLTCGMTQPHRDSTDANVIVSTRDFPLAHFHVHGVARKSRPYDYLNLFGAPRNIESEIYESADERAEVFEEVGLRSCFTAGVNEMKKEGGEIGRAAMGVIKALKLAGRDSG